MKPEPTESLPPDERDFTPRGALFFGALFLILMVAIWGTMYWILLER